MSVTLRFRLNGEPVTAQVPGDRVLCDFLREDCGLTGTKHACGVGVCGACTVLLGDKPVSSCLLLAACVDGGEVWTIEGVASRAPALVESFAEEEGLQCGICTPGHVVSAYALLARTPRPTPDQVVEWMAGTLCRCTGYQSILRSIRAAVERGAVPPNDARGDL